MITLPGKSGIVFEIQDCDVRVPDKVTSPSPFDPAKTTTKYVAPSTGVLVNVRDNEIYLTIGKDASERVLKNVLGFGLKTKKPMKILKCEVISNLREFDRMVVLCNSIIEQQTDVDLETFFNTDDDYEPTKDHKNPFLSWSSTVQV